MADTLKDAMREFRFLDDKRKERVLSAEEEGRWRSLLTLVGGSSSVAPPAWQTAPQVPGYGMENPTAWASDAPPPPGFDHQAQAHWGPDGAYYPPGFDMMTGRWLDPAYEQAYATGYVWDAAAQNWATLYPEGAAPAPAPTVDPAPAETVAQVPPVAAEPVFDAQDVAGAVDLLQAEGEPAPAAQLEPSTPPVEVVLPPAPIAPAATAPALAELTPAIVAPESAVVVEPAIVAPEPAPVLEQPPTRESKTQPAIELPDETSADLAQKEPTLQAELPLPAAQLEPEREPTVLSLLPPPEATSAPEVAAPPIPIPRQRTQPAPLAPDGTIDSGDSGNERTQVEEIEVPSAPPPVIVLPLPEPLPLPAQAEPVAPAAMAVPEPIEVLASPPTEPEPISELPEMETIVALEPDGPEPTEVPEPPSAWGTVAPSWAPDPLPSAGWADAEPDAEPIVVTEPDAAAFGDAPKQGWTEEPVETPLDRSVFGAPASTVPEPEAEQPAPEPVPEPALAPAPKPAQPIEEPTPLPSVIVADVPELSEVPLAAASDFVTFQGDAPAETIELSPEAAIVLGDPEERPAWQGPSTSPVELSPDDAPMELVSASDFVSYVPEDEAAPEPVPAEAALPPAAQFPPAPAPPPAALTPPAPTPLAPHTPAASELPPEWSAPAPIAPPPPAPFPRQPVVVSPLPAAEAEAIDAEPIEEIDVVEGEGDLPPLAAVPPAAPPPAPPARAPQPVLAQPSPQPLRATPQALPAQARPAAPTSAPVPAAPPGPAPAMPSLVPGEHRVVVHTLEGQVKRGTVRTVNLDAEVMDLEVIPGQPPERLATRRLKAVFFLLAPGAKPPSPEGTKLRVTFYDERQVAGFAPVYRTEDNGFFMFPADTRTNTARIYIYRGAVKNIARG